MRAWVGGELLQRITTTASKCGARRRRCDVPCCVDISARVPCENPPCVWSDAAPLSFKDSALRCDVAIELDPAPPLAVSLPGCTRRVSGPKKPRPESEQRPSGDPADREIGAFY